LAIPLWPRTLSCQGCQGCQGSCEVIENDTFEGCELGMVQWCKLSFYKTHHFHAVEECTKDIKDHHVGHQWQIQRELQVVDSTKPERATYCFTWHGCICCTHTWFDIFDIRSYNIHLCSMSDPIELLLRS
jgi:hypothetical protein